MSISNPMNRIRKSKRMSPAIDLRDVEKFHIHPRSLANPMKRGNDGLIPKEAIEHAEKMLAKQNEHG